MLIKNWLFMSNFRVQILEQFTVRILASFLFLIEFFFSPIKIGMIVSLSLLFFVFSLFANYDEKRKNINININEEKEEAKKQGWEKIVSSSGSH